MKNIHVLPTDKPSRLAYDFYEKFYLLSEDTQFFEFQNLVQNRELYITSDEEIKEGDYFPLYNEWDNKIEGFKKWDGKLPLMVKGLQLKIILTTDQDLIKNGVQAIGDEFLRWFIKNPSCEEVEVDKGYRGLNLFNYKIIIPKKEPKQETLKEAKQRILDSNYMTKNDADFIAGAKWQAQRMYSEEESIQKIIDYVAFQFNVHGELDSEIKKWFEQFKKK